MTAFFTSFFLVALAEMADKTQLLSLSLACRYPPRKVLLGVALAIALLNLVAVAAGALLGQLLPIMWVKVAAGVLFIGFGVWTLLDKDDEEENEGDIAGPGRNVVLAVMGASSSRRSGTRPSWPLLPGRQVRDVVRLRTGVAGSHPGDAAGQRAGDRRRRAARQAHAATTAERLSGALFLVVGVWTILEALVF